MATLKPLKPREDFPLFPADNGQWAKKVKGKRYHFGSWTDDPQGVAALADWVTRKDGIEAGLDSVRAKGPVVAGYTLGQLAKDFIASRKLKVDAGELSLRTLLDYQHEVNDLLKVLPAEGQVAALRPEHFNRVAKSMVEARKLGRHARRRAITYAKTMFTWGAGNSKHPVIAFGSDFKAPDTSPDAMRQAKARAGIADYSARIVTGEEVDHLLKRANPNFRAMILLGLNCGLGPADIGRLKWSDIDLEKKRLDMPRGKTGTDRRGKLWPRTVAALNRVAKLKYMEARRAKAGPTALVFITRKGLAYYREEEGKYANPIPFTFRRIVQDVSKRQGIKLDGVTFYRLRHTFKTLGKKGRDADALNLMMGHTERSTGKRYDHEEISWARIAKVAKKIHRRLWPVEKAKTTVDNVPQMRLVG